MLTNLNSTNWTIANIAEGTYTWGATCCANNGECVWEGEMILKYETMVNTQIISKTVGSSNNTDSVFISNQYFIKFIGVKLVDPCSNSNPNPEIESATVVVRKE